MDQEVGLYIEDGRAKRERVGVPGACGAAIPFQDTAMREISFFLFNPLF